MENVTGFLGLGMIDKTKNGEDAMIYEAGVSYGKKPDSMPAGLEYKILLGGKYARFLLTGSYSQIAPAFDKIFKTIAENKTVLREDYCIENYLNDPKITPEAELLTELLLPLP